MQNDTGLGFIEIMYAFARAGDTLVCRTHYVSFFTAGDFGTAADVFIEVGGPVRYAGRAGPACEHLMSHMLKISRDN